MLELQQSAGNQGDGNVSRRPKPDVFGQLLGEGWEAQGDGTYRFVGVDRSSPDVANPERSKRATREGQASRPTAEAEQTASSVETRKRGRWRKR